ncbi:MAG: hypothetical protein GJU76_09345 [Gallionella sp.]|nr:hypothetical protein [Gallionella sp.]
MLVIIFGLVVGLGAYSYGMFHTLSPTASDLLNVAHCGQHAIAGGGGAVVNQGDAGDDKSALCYSPAHIWVRTSYSDGPIFLALAILFGSTLVGLHKSRFLKWAAKSGLGHQVLGQLLFGIPMTLLFLHLNFVEGTLTADWAGHVIAYGLVGGAVMGLILWYAVTRPLLAGMAARSNSRR